MRSYFYLVVIIGFIVGVFASYWFQPIFYRAFVPFGDYITELPMMFKNSNQSMEAKTVIRTCITVTVVTTILFSLVGYANIKRQKQAK